MIMTYNLLRNIRVLHRSFEEIPEQQAHLCSTPRVCQNLSPEQQLYFIMTNNFIQISNT